MSYFIDVKYLNQIGGRLPLFAKKKKDLWNCRCIICGDSQKKKNKARGYFYRQKNDLFYKCHNCSVSLHFGTFLEKLDASLYKEYVFERYSSGMNGPKAHKSAEKMFKFEEPEFNINPLNKVAEKLSNLPGDHEVVQYCKNRGIPEEKYSELYYIDSVKNIAKIAPKYKNIQSTEPRLVLPFFDENDNLVGVSMRGVRGESLRYIMIKLKEDANMVFNQNKINKNENIIIVEGPIDSLFLDNSLAVAGTGFNKIETLGLPEDKVTIVFDNQPRNKEVCTLVEKYINLNYRVCIWPCDIKEKDINDMIMAGRDVNKIINDNVYEGLTAQLKFTEWRNC